ncbi:MAG TPA: GlxA family transcriptional regulator [Acidimicrobiales bacterium]|nr:GlxA family transcriptional regulator [Acidimicrobiales bacterium]
MVVIVAFDGFQSLDLSGPAEVFAAAGWPLRIVTVDGEPVRSSSGITIVPDGDLTSARGPIDILLVVGGDGTPAAMRDARLLAWLRRTARRSRRVTSVCSGAFVLAEAGLLDGRRATTHWSVCDALAERYPTIEVDPDPIYVRDGDVWTSAGVTAGMDLALALVEEDLGRDVALAIARRLVLFLRRPGNQSQFSAQLSLQSADRDALRDVQHHIAEHLDDDLSVDALAARAAMSPRHFARCFRDETGATPARFVEAARIEAARRRLEESDDSIESIARACGFGTAETMRRAFARVLHVAPTEYRRRFATAS